MPFMKKIRAILIGSILLAIGINFFLVPFHLLDGGIIGVGLIINYIWGVKAGFAMILLSVPIFLIAWYRYRQYFYNSVHGLLFSSICIDFLSPLQSSVIDYVPLSLISSSIIGGILVGLGIGIMLRHETSTGGTDLLAQFIGESFSINVGVVIFIIDLIVVSLGGVLISTDTFLPSFLVIVVVGITTSLCTWRVLI